MTNSNKEVEGKQYFKTKVGYLMQEYQRSQQVSQLQKQQIKHNIMIDILNKRKIQKDSPIQQQQIKSEPTKTFTTDPLVSIAPSDHQIDNKYPNQVQIKKNTHSATNSLRRNQADQPQHFEDVVPKLEEMTFNMKKRSKVSENESNLQVEIQNQINEEKPQKLQQDSSDFTKSINRMAKYANKYFPYTFKQEQEPDIQLEDEFQYQQKLEKSKNPSIFEHYPLHKQQHQSENQFLQRIEYSDKEEEDQLELQQKIEEDQRGVFVTMQDSQSMSASQLPKNCTYEIKMDKSADPDHLQDLKRQKIRQIQRKRMERIQEYRKHEANKKVVEIPKGRYSKHVKTDKNQDHQVDTPPPKTVTIERKSNAPKPPKMENRSQREHVKKNQPIPLEHYNKPKYSYKQLYEQQKKNTGHKQMPSYYEEPVQKLITPHRTPKSIVSEQRSKSSHRTSNIFTGDSQYPRQKSVNRIPSPKIQPKDRKNSFTRQSNKKLMINAITHVCFPGQLNRKERQKLVDVIESSEFEFFLFLFKEYSRKIIKGIYVFDNTQTKLERIFGQKAPYQITVDRVKEFYRFDSGSRQFKKIDGCRSFSLAIHAIDLR